MGRTRRLPYAGRAQHRPGPTRCSPGPGCAEGAVGGKGRQPDPPGLASPPALTFPGRRCPGDGRPLLSPTYLPFQEGPQGHRPAGAQGSLSPSPPTVVGQAELLVTATGGPGIVLTRPCHDGSWPWPRPASAWGLGWPVPGGCLSLPRLLLHKIPCTLWLKAAHVCPDSSQGQGS